MPATTGYSAGVEANQTRIAYAMETVWGGGVTSASPNADFQAIRYMSDTLAFTKTRQRPNEINTTREASQAVTTQQTAGGSINFALSYSVYDDFFSVALQQDWQTAASSINASTVDMAVTSAAGVVKLTSTSSSKFNALTQGQWIKTYGWVNAANNSWWYIQTKVTGQELIVQGPTHDTAVAETSTNSVHIRYSTIINGISFRSMYIQQKLSNAMFLVYPGSYVSRMTVSGGVGNFFTGAIDIVAKNENDLPAEPLQGAHVTQPAPSNIVMDPVLGFVGAFWNGVAIAGSLDQMAFTIENTGAAPEYALGSATAVGILSGTFTASGTFRMYFNDFINYNLFQAETGGVLSFILRSSTGNSYVFTFPNAVLMERVPVGGPGQAVYAEMTFEGNPDPVAATGGTFRIDRLPNS